MPQKTTLLSFGLAIFSFFLITQKVFATSPIQWGAYTGWQVSDFQNFSSKVGATPNYAAVFIHWGNENDFPADIAKMVKNNNQTLVIYWEAMDYNVTDLAHDSNYSYDAILSGKYDSYISSFAASVKASGVPVVLIPFEEMNSDWYPWSVTFNGNTPQKHVQAYRHIHDLFTGVSNVKFGWAINNDSVPDTAANDPSGYYPGDAYVDYVGVDGFNFGNPWQTFSQVFDKPLLKLKQFNKPAMIFSMASAPGANKAAWIQDAASKISNYPQLIGWIWFNENKEKNWLVWSDQNSLSAFQNYLIPEKTSVTTVTPTLKPSPTATSTPTITPSPTKMPSLTLTPTRIPSLTPSAVIHNTEPIINSPTPTPVPRKHKKRFREYLRNFSFSTFLNRH